MELTRDSQVILLLASHLALPVQSELAPLGSKEWKQLLRKLDSADLAGQSVLGDLSSEQIAETLDLHPNDADRIARLLERANALSDEIERLDRLGIWAVTLADESYPSRLRERLKESAPPVLFGAGDATLPGKRGLAVVGSRNIDESGRSLSETIGAACARSKLVVYSGGARGVDATAMGAVLEAGGATVGVLADSLEKTLRSSWIRSAIEEDKLALLTPYSPAAGFTIGAAMGRNKLIYALADYALVIASDLEKGGTWAGAIEALKAGWAPVFAVDRTESLPGNRALIQKGALPFPDSFSERDVSLAEWLEGNAPGEKPEAAGIQYSLF